MKRWRRVIRVTAIALLVIVLGLTGALMWLQSSGRLTRYAQELVQEYSGRNLSFESLALTSWNVVALTNVRLQQTLPGWQLDVACPRLEAHYTLLGLLRKHVASVHLMQPIVHLKTIAATSASDARSTTPEVIVLPVGHLEVRDATLRVDHGNALNAFEQIDISVHQITAQHVGIDARAKFDDDTAQVHIKGDISLDLTHLTGTFNASLRQVSAPRLAASGLLPSDWTLTQGNLNVVASQVELHGQTLQGSLKIDLEHGHGDIAAVTVQGAAMTTDITFEADLADRIVKLQGPMHLRAETVRQVSSGLVATQLTAQLPVQLTYAPEQWHLQTDLRLQSEQIKLAAAGGIQLQQLSHAVAVDAKSTPKGWSLEGDLTFAAPSASIASIRLEQVSGKTPVTFTMTAPAQWQSTIDLSLQSQILSTENASHFRLQTLSSQLPLVIKSTPSHWVIEGTADMNAHRLHVGADKQAATGLAFERVQSQLPLRITSTALTSPDLRLQAKAVRWQPPGTDTPMTSPLDLRTSIDINLQRRQVEAKNLVLDLPALGRITGGSAWQWTTGTAQDVHLTIAPTTLETVWPLVAALLPAPYPTWLVSGQTQIELRAPSLVWRRGAPTQPLVLDWRFSGMTFSSPAGDYAGENISGQVAANVSLAPDWRPVSVQASLTLKPFALLVGSFFPELEKNHIESNVTLNSVYHPKTGHVDLHIDGEFTPLGRIAIEARLDRSHAPIQADITCRLSHVDVQNVWQTFMPEALRQAADPPAMQGRFNARLQLRGTLSNAHVQGDLQLAEFDLQAGALNLRNLSLQLPLDIRYPLPEHLPDLADLSASAYGQLHLERLQFGGLLIPGIATKLALRSDSIIFQKDIRASLLNGVLHLHDLVAYRLLQSQRQIQMRLQLRSLDLQDLQRHNDALPIAGQVDADFSRLHFQNGHLQTEGSMQLRVAGGRIRIYDVAGWDLWSQIPSIQSSLKTEVPLSLHQLTQLYPIGSIGGTLHVTVDDLTITAGEPAAFRLHFYVQEQGGEARQISLRALNNLLFTAGSAKVATNFTDQLPYRRFGAEITLKHDTLRLRGLYNDRQGREYFMRAPALGSGISIVNERPKNNSIAFRSFVQRLKSTVLEGPDVNVK
jgi:hypothetical protein